jgi:putative hemolysin
LDGKEKEMVAYRLVDMMGCASAANILGITVRERDKFVEVLRCRRDLRLYVTQVPQSLGRMSLLVMDRQSPK